jgi:cysteinyl-tRNA synthetase
VRDLLDQGIPGEVMRFVFLSTHYRKPMDWTEKKARDARAVLQNWRALTQGADPIGVDDEVARLIGDDLNTAGALTRLHAMAKEIASNPQKDCAIQKGVFLASAQLLGLLSEDAGDWGETTVDLSAFAARLTDLRETAMQSKDFAPVDAMKSALLAAGVEVRMSKAGVELVPGPDFDAAKLDQMP